MKSKQYIDLDAAAAYLGISKSVLYRLTAARTIDHYKLCGERGKRGGRIMFTYEDLDRFMVSKKIRAL